MIIKILYIQFASVFLPILGTLLVQGFIFERGPTIFKIFKNTICTICTGLCKLKCPEKRFIPLPPSIFSLSLSHTEFKGRPEAATWNVLYHTSFRNYAAISLQVPSILSILLGVDDKLGQTRRTHLKQIVRVNTSHLTEKFRKSVDHVHTQLFNEIPSGIHHSLNPRPELLVGKDDDLPVHVGHYLGDLDPEGGQGVMRLFIDLSLKYAPQGRI